MTDTHENVVEFMRTRRSVPARNLSAPGPDDAQIREIIEIASRVPDHGKLAPWRFIRYSPDYCRELGERFLARAMQDKPEMSDADKAAERERFTAAPVVIAVVSRAAPHPKIPEWEQELSAGAAAMNLLIAANAFGWDAQWLTDWVAFDRELAPSLGLEPGERVAGFIHIGTRTMPKTERDRPNIDNIYKVMGE